jgi:hypothetical protein
MDDLIPYIILSLIIIPLVCSLKFIKPKQRQQQRQPYKTNNQLSKDVKWSCIYEGMKRADIHTMNDEINQRIMRGVYFDKEACIEAVYQYYLIWRFGK